MAETAQKTNGGYTEQVSAPANAIRNIEFLNVWRCLSSLPKSKLLKETGTSKEPKPVERYFTPEQIAKVVRMKKLMRDHYEELYEIENTLEEQKRKIGKEVSVIMSQDVKTKQDEERLAELTLQLNVAVSDHNAHLNRREHPLPDFGQLKFALSSLDGFTLINNDYAEYFWDFMVDLDT